MEKSGSAARREKLEVPSAAAFERRFLVDPGAGSRPNITAPTAPSELLSRLQTFLPAMQSANQQLQHVKEPQIDDARDTDCSYVELDLACGLFDLKDPGAVAAAERSLTQQRVAVERFDGGSSSSSSDDNSEDELSADVDEHIAAQGGCMPYAAEPLPIVTAGAGAGLCSTEATERQVAGSNRQQQAATGQGRRHVKGKQKRRRAGIEVLG